MAKIGEKNINMAKRQQYVDKIDEMKKYSPAEFMKGCVWMLRQSLASSDINESDLFYLIDRVRGVFLEIVDIPEGYFVSEDDNEQTSLFD